jgi:hypothetical protein
VIRYGPTATNNIHDILNVCASIELADELNNLNQHYEHFSNTINNNIIINNNNLEISTIVIAQQHNENTTTMNNGNLSINNIENDIRKELKQSTEAVINDQQNQSLITVSVITNEENKSATKSNNNDNIINININHNEADISTILSEEITVDDVTVICQQYQNEVSNKPPNHNSSSEINYNTKTNNNDHILNELRDIDPKHIHKIHQRINNLHDKIENVNGLNRMIHCYAVQTIINDININDYHIIDYKKRKKRDENTNNNSVQLIPT